MVSCFDEFPEALEVSWRMAQKTTDCEHAISQENTVQGFSFVLLIIVRVANRTDDQKTVKSESMGAPGRRATCHLSDFAETWPV